MPEAYPWFKNKSCCNDVTNTLDTHFTSPVTVLCKMFDDVKANLAFQNLLKNVQRPTNVALHEFL